MVGTSTYQADTFGYATAFRRRRSRTDWAGVNIGDAFKHTIEYYLRLQAQREFYQRVKEIQISLAHEIQSPDPEKPKVKPQLSPFYTNYPAILSAYAAIGLTGYLEIEIRLQERVLLTFMADYLKNPAKADNVSVDPQIYQKFALLVAKCVQTRLLLEELSRLPTASSIELYRIFSASQQTTKFRSVPDILRAVILYRDILPDYQNQGLHPMTRALLEDLTNVCIPFFNRLPDIKPQCILIFGSEWVRKVCRCLSKYLPEPKKEEGQGQNVPQESNPSRAPSNKANPLEEKDGQSPSKDRDGEIAPINAQKSPCLFDETTIAERLLNTLRQGIEPDGKKGLPAPNPIHKNVNLNKLGVIMASIAVIESAGSQQRKWEDIRSDILEKLLCRSDFTQNPIQGNPVDGHTVTMSLGGLQGLSEDIYDRAIELSDDLPAYEKLIGESTPITKALRRTLYPNTEQVPKVERFCSSGSIDPARLALADVSAAIFKRYRVHKRLDRRGRPVLLIACDASGSLNERQIRMLKVLTAAWLNSTAKTRIQVIAGIYHSGDIQLGTPVPLVQWMYHPKKTPATGRMDATRALISLPQRGTGRQSDALSLTFMLDEAHQLARGRMVYVIIITDCKWNKSFHTNWSGRDEVCACLCNAYKKFSKCLHTTLIALGVSGSTGLENILDKVITVSDQQLNDYRAVASTIGLYVASCMKERNKWIAGY